ncbi:MULTISPECIES: PLP-dependent aminotransferase family protein [Rhodococcus]|uniref:GntR family transcriptional regulator n=1 Tax=Rhodococcus qingshengii TaxID=334542 RepID=A0A2A5JAD3_RHOSG|nr:MULTISPECIES: PLP-dependent aminotransferase family protein [Rhodococcus]PCK26302.1 GntR family transcriptional regulator [Rhodococcus qingshengii]
MVNSWANLGFDLHIELPQGIGVRAALLQTLRDAIDSGLLKPGTRLPPSRTLALDLGVARNTVADCYAELAAAGWLVTRPGSGTLVATLASTHTREVEPSPTRRRWTYSLLPGSPDASAFPRTAWISSARRALTTAPTDAFATTDPRGRVELRNALTTYLSRTRGVRVDPNCIVISASSGHGISLLARALGGTIAVDAFCLHLHRQLLADEGLLTVPISVDQSGTCTDELASTSAESVLLTPTHQFPLGGPLTPARRATALEWATTTGGVIIEDDYDGEFRYDRKPVGALQGIAPQHVAYLGTVSKTLSPAIRIGWMVLPDRLIEPVLATKGPYERWVSSTDQLTLADFIESGRFDSHIRKMRTSYRRRRDQLVATLAQQVPQVRVEGISAGLHAVIRLPSGTEQSVLAAAQARDLGLEGLSVFRHPDVSSVGGDGIVVGYSTPTQSQYSRTLDVLCEVLQATLR